VDKWLPVSGGSEPASDSEEAAFLEEGRMVLHRLRPIRAHNTWAAPPQKSLTLVIPLDRSPASSLERRGALHTSVQLMMRDWKRGPEIVGAWHDAHYAWDYEPKEAAFSVAGHGPESRSQALAWMQTQLQRSVIRDEWAAFGLTLALAWRHADGGPNFINEVQGLFPVALLLRGHPTRSVAAGFFDPW
jgi:hypothetical protein